MTFTELKLIARSDRSNFYEILKENGFVNLEEIAKLEEIFKKVKINRHKRFSKAEDNFQDCLSHLPQFCEQCGSSRYCGCEDDFSTTVNEYFEEKI